MFLKRPLWLESDTTLFSHHAAAFSEGLRGLHGQEQGNSGGLRGQASYVVNNLPAFCKFNSVTQEALYYNGLIRKM